MRTAYVHYGCGCCAPREWLNFDASPTLRLQRLPLVGRWLPSGGPLFPANVLYGDIVRGLPVPSGECRAVYCSHILEHLSLNDFRIALRNTRRLLAAGGIFRLVVPDLRAAAERYLADASSASAGRFMLDTSLGVEERARGLAGFARSWLGNSRHLWMWDFESLRAELRTAGFKNVRRAAFRDSEEPMFGQVEEQARWLDAVGVQCYA
jgi:SAM-dependent methyltransferase